MKIENHVEVVSVLANHLRLLWRLRITSRVPGFPFPNSKVNFQFQRSMILTDISYFWEGWFPGKGSFLELVPNPKGSAAIWVFSTPKIVKVSFGL